MDAKSIDRKFSLSDRWNSLVLDLLKLTASTDAKDVLEVGCGVGALSLWISQKFDNVNGMDITKRAVTFANTQRRKSPCRDRLSLMIGDGKFLPLRDCSYDLCICSETLEHVPNYEKVFDELSRVTKNSGFIVVTVPNYVNMTQGGVGGPARFVWSFLRRFRASQPTDINHFDIFVLRKLFASRNLKILAMRGIGLFIIPYKNRKIAWVEQMFNRPFDRLKFISLNLGVIGQKSKGARY